MQTKVLDTFIKSEDGQLYCDNSLYTSIMFSQKNEQELAGYYVENGVVVKPYIPYYLSYEINDTTKMMDYDKLEIEGEIAVDQDGSLYTGIAIIFDESGVVTGEQYYEDGPLAAEANWDKNLILTDCHLDYGLVSERCQWNNGLLNFYTTLKMTLRFNEFNELNLIGLTKGTENHFNNVKKHLKFSPITDFCDIFKFNPSKELILDGEGVNDAFIEDAMKSCKLDNVVELALHDNEIFDFNFLLKLPNIRKIMVYISFNETHVKSKLINILKKKSDSEFKIILNNKELVL